jgi:hypothetical protein
MSGPARLVFSDVDETLIRVKSMFDFLAAYLGEKHEAAGAERAERLRQRLLAQAAAGVPRAETNRSYYRDLGGRGPA